MEKRRLGKTGWYASVIGFGAWAIGADWGEADDDTSRAALRAAAEAGVNFFDTADVYGDGRSERLVAELRRELSDSIFVATKAGRRAPEQRVEHYSPENLIAWTDRSRENLGMETLDLVQLHCPPTDLFYHPEVFATLDDLVSAGAVAHYGVSVERVEEGLKALDYPGVATVQIIYNIFRQRPAARFLGAAHQADVGVIVRVPLASGLLTGKMTRRHQVRRRRPPQLQPSRRGLRRRRDLLGREPRYRSRCRRRASPTRACKRDDGGVRAALLPVRRWCLDGDPGRKEPGPGASERRCRRARTARGAHPRAPFRHLPRAHRPFGPLPLVRFLGERGAGQVVCSPSWVMVPRRGLSSRGAPSSRATTAG